MAGTPLSLPFTSFASRPTMTVDQLKNDLLLLSVNARDLVSALSALGNSVSVTETAVGASMIIYLSN